MLNSRHPRSTDCSHPVFSFCDAFENWKTGTHLVSLSSTCGSKGPYDVLTQHRVGADLPPSLPEETTLRATIGDINQIYPSLMT